MSPLRLFTGNRLELLAEALARVLETPLASPLDQEVIVVQSKGMERWVSMQLALHFNQVHAIDVSEKMIEYAKNNISSSSVAFHLTNGMDIPLADQSVFSVFSTHVFQHFDSLSVADRYFAEIARTMKTDGTLMIHLPIYRWPSKSRILRMIFAADKTIEDIRARGRRALMHHGMAKPSMRWLSYPIEYFYEVLPKHGFDDIELAVFVTKSNNDPHSFIFARKNI